MSTGDGRNRRATSMSGGPEDPFRYPDPFSAPANPAAGPPPPYEAQPGSAGPGPGMWPQSPYEAGPGAHLGGPNETQELGSFGSGPGGFGPPAGAPPAGGIGYPGPGSGMLGGPSGGRP